MNSSAWILLALGLALAFGPLLVGKMQGKPRWGVYVTVFMLVTGLGGYALCSIAPKKSALELWSGIGMVLLPVMASFGFMTFMLEVYEPRSEDAPEGRAADRLRSLKVPRR